MFTDIIWRFLILETLVTGVLCVFCIGDHPQKLFCITEFVLEATVHEEIHLPVGDGYRMEIRNIIKGNVEELNITDNRYVNVEESWWGGPPLIAGKIYVIFGHNNNGIISIDMCEGIAPSEKITPFLISVPYYKTGCDCIDEIGSHTLETSCYWYHSYIKRDDEYNCNWPNTLFPDICENN